MTDRLRWGILSTAHINRRLIPAIRAAARSDLAAVASRDEARAQAYAAEWKIPQAFGSYEALLESPEIDVVYIPLPNHLHAEWAQRAAGAGKHMLVEKPLALSTAEVDKMEAAAKAAGVVAAEAVMPLYHPLLAQMRRYLAEGVIGEVFLARGAYSLTLGRPGNYRWVPEYGGGALWDLGLYPVTLIRWLLGEPEEVFGWMKTAEGGVDESFAGLLRYPGGVLGEFDCGYRHQFRVQAEVVGSEGQLRLERPFAMDHRSRLVLVKGDERELLAASEHNQYQCEVEAMAAAVLDGEPMPVSLAFSRANVAVLSALYQAAVENRPVVVTG